MRLWSQRNWLRIDPSSLSNRQVFLLSSRGFLRRNLWPSRRFQNRLIFIAWVWTWTWIRTRTGPPSKKNPLTSLPPSRRRCLQRLRRLILNRRFRVHRSQTFPRSITLLIERHARIFYGGCSYRTIFAKHVLSFVPVAQHHLFGEKNIPFEPTMEINFPW